MNGKLLGKIDKCYFGIGGYNDAMIGIHFQFSSGSTAVGSTKSAWDAETIKHTEYCKWTESDRDQQYAEIVRYVSKILKEAKCEDVSRLVGKPVELTFESNTLKEWRILTEVL